MKAFLAACEMLALWPLAALLRRRKLPAGRLLVLAWSPLALVETAGRCAGQTVADPRRLWDPLPELDVCTAVDAPRLLDLFHDRLGLRAD